MSEILAALIAEKGLNPMAVANLFKEAFTPDKLVSNMRDILLATPDRLSLDRIMEDLVNKELAPFIYEKIPARDTLVKLPDGPSPRIATANQDMNFTGHPRDALKKDDGFHVVVIIGGENDLREQFKPGGQIEEQVKGSNSHFGHSSARRTG